MLSAKCCASTFATSSALTAAEKKMPGPAGKNKGAVDSQAPGPEAEPKKKVGKHKADADSQLPSPEAKKLKPEPE